MLTSLSVILVFLLLGDVISMILAVSVPGSVIGMILLTAALWTGVVKDEWIKPGAKLLIDHMAFLFVPAGVGLMVHLEVFKGKFLSLASAILISTLVTMAVTGLVQQLLEKRSNHK
jgi:holin-like protein